MKPQPPSIDDKEIEWLKSQVGALEVNNDMLRDENKQLHAECEQLCADLNAAQAKIKRWEHSADHWRNAWTRTDRKLQTAQKFVGLMAWLLVVVLAVCVWGAV